MKTLQNKHAYTLTLCIFLNASLTYGQQIRIVDESRIFGLEISQRKSFCMTVSRKNESPKCILEIDGIEIKQVEKLEYLKELITSHAKSDQDIQRRIGIAKAAFKCITNVLTARDFNSCSEHVARDEATGRYVGLRHPPQC